MKEGADVFMRAFYSHRHGADKERQRRAADARTRIERDVALTVASLGDLGTTTGASADLQSNFDGALGKLAVTRDVKDAYVKVVDTSGKEKANIGSIKIGQSLIGGATANSGYLYADNLIGAVTSPVTCRAAPATKPDASLPGIGTGNTNVNDHFGIVAEEIGKLNIGGKAFVTTAGKDHGEIDIGNYNFAYLEV